MARKSRHGWNDSSPTIHLAEMGCAGLGFLCPSQSLILSAHTATCFLKTGACTQSLMGPRLCCLRGSSPALGLARPPMQPCLLLFYLAQRSLRSILKLKKPLSCTSLCFTLEWLGQKGLGTLMQWGERKSPRPPWGLQQLTFWAQKPHQEYWCGSCVSCCHFQRVEFRWSGKLNLVMTAQQAVVFQNPGRHSARCKSPRQRGAEMFVHPAGPS